MGMLIAKSRNGLRPLWARDPFAALREEMNDLRSQLMGEGEGWFAGELAPSLDMSESDNALDVRMDLPGITAKDIDIQVTGNMLTVSGERKEEKEEKGKTFHRAERRYGRFSRSVTLPCSVDENEVAAEYHDGVLLIKLPKAEDSKGAQNQSEGLS